MLTWRDDEWYSIIPSRRYFIARISFLGFDIFFFLNVILLLILLRIEIPFAFKVNFNIEVSFNFQFCFLYSGRIVSVGLRTGIRFL